MSSENMEKSMHKNYASRLLSKIMSEQNNSKKSLKKENFTVTVTEEAKPFEETESKEPAIVS